MNATSEKIVGIVQHLANMTFIFDMHEKLGTVKSPLLMKEFEAATKALTKALEEKQNARKSNQQRDGIDEDRTDPPREIPRGSLTNRPDPGKPSLHR